jgi:pilus assembly protein CpaB
MPFAAALPPPLPATRPPWSLRWRAMLWRWRLLVAALGGALSLTAGLHALAPASTRTVPLVVAVRDMPAGTELGTSDVRVQRVPAGLVPRGAATAATAVEGESTAVPLARGTPLVPGVLAPHDVHGPPGTVVASVRFADPAVARLLTAGVHVDVVAADAEGGTGRTVASRALVLPPPRAATSKPAVGLSALGSTSADEATPPVLVAVTPDEATALAGASASSLLSAVVVP